MLRLDIFYIDIAVSGPTPLHLLFDQFLSSLYKQKVCIFSDHNKQKEVDFMYSECPLDRRKDQLLRKPKPSARIIVNLYSSCNSYLKGSRGRTRVSLIFFE